MYATGSSFEPSLKEAGVLDTAVLTLRFPSGALVTLDMSRYNPAGYDQRIEVFGPKGTLAVLNPPELAVQGTSAAGTLAARHPHSFPQRFAEAFAGEVEHFARVVLDGERPRVAAADAATAQAIAMAGLASFRSGKAVDFVSPVQAPPLRLRFIGCGSFGEYIRSAVLQAADAPATFELLPAYTRRSASALGLDLTGAMAADHVDAVYICTPDAQHTAHTLAALEAGCHVLVEKPVLGFCERVCRRAADADCVLMIGYHRRFHPDFMAARTVVQVLLQEMLADHPASAAGFPVQRSAANPLPPHRPVLTRIVLRSFDPVPQEPDQAFVLANSLCHDLDMAQWLCAPAAVQLREVRSSQPNNTFALALAVGDVPISIEYCKGHGSYVQQVVVETRGSDGQSSRQVFGFDYTGANMGEPYLVAYKAQFAHFARQIRAHERGVGRLARHRLRQSYAVTDRLLEAALARLSPAARLSNSKL